MPPGYTTTQKNAISQFMAFTSTDRNTAVRHLKSHNWSQESAVNGYVICFQFAIALSS
ncbi:hypothetical protein AOQ84DRAFT_285683 [Glonium stellatum]|uniref:Uncharacterized protein n=1 Tax=Glonium stellatum TaxID=574774 RepID=A0A8E2F8C6_9PEZI|nr:hypothetical protein AOQ84DRAFT_285683 [Glonium stellatum]